MRAIVFLFILLLCNNSVSSKEILYSEEYKIDFSSENITEKKEPPVDSDNFKDEENKFKKYFKENI